LYNMLSRILNSSISKSFANRTVSNLNSRSFSTTQKLGKEIELFIDGKPVQIEEGSAIIQAAEKIHVDIPRFCYHERLGVAGNCRMCLVEVEKNPKLVASCAFPVTPGMKVITTSDKIKKAREGVMEFLLANHPLDCPICDQGGECDLQEQSMRYGSDRSRFLETKRAVEDKSIGPLVKMIMTRCIQCTRCVRFTNEVAGAPELGTTGRGNDMQIGTYIGAALKTEMSGNIVDLCPVGALTNAPYSFQSRPWELKHTETIDTMDGIGSNIRVDTRDNEVMRILPRTNDLVNEEWISDKTRFAVDGLKNQRLANPLIRVDNRFVAATWEEALQVIANQFRNTNPENMCVVAGNQADAESLVAIKDLFNAAGCEDLRLDTRPGSTTNFNSDIRSNYLLNTTLSGVEHSDALLIIGANPKVEAPILNTRLRKAYLHNNLKVAVVGEPVELTYEYSHVGSDISSLASLLDGSHPFLKTLQTAKKPMILLGSAVSELPNSESVLAAAATIAKGIPNLITDEWNGFNMLQNYASRAAALDIGFKPQTSSQKSDSSFVYLLAADEFDTKAVMNENSFVVYQGHHGDKGAHLANVVLPGAAYTEKVATYVNTEGRVQVTRAALDPPNASREDWQIIRALSEFIGLTLPYSSIDALRGRMSDVSPTLVQTNSDVSTPSKELSLLGLETLAASLPKKSNLASSLSGKFIYPISNFYMTDPISRSSPTMAKATSEFLQPSNKATAEAA
ncbi:hypothetical protein BB560_002782, partial [Smittium megazygosporum]